MPFDQVAGDPITNDRDGSIACQPNPVIDYRRGGLHDDIVIISGLNVSHERLRLLEILLGFHLCGPTFVYPWIGCECCKGTVWVPFKLLRERIPMLSAMTLDQLGAKMKCDRCGKRPERYYPANQSDTPGFVRRI